MERDCSTPSRELHDGSAFREGTWTRSPAPRIPRTTTESTSQRRSAHSPQSSPHAPVSTDASTQPRSRRPHTNSNSHCVSEPSWRQRPSTTPTTRGDGTGSTAAVPGRHARRTSPSGNSPDEDRRRCQRDKQISFGYATAGYVNMERLIRHDPLLKSGGLLPLAPPKTDLGSKRMWDIQVRKWRRALHMFDYVYIDGEDDPAMQATVLEEQRQQWVSEVFQGASREQRQTVSLEALHRARLSSAVPTRIPVEKDLRGIIRSDDCYESVSSVIPQSASSLTKGTDISPLEAGIKIHIAPSSAVLQRQLAQKELQLRMSSLYQQQHQQASSSEEGAEAAPTAADATITPPSAHRPSAPACAAQEEGSTDPPRSPSPRRPFLQQQQQQQPSSLHGGGSRTPGKTAAAAAAVHASTLGGGGAADGTSMRVPRGNLASPAEPTPSRFFREPSPPMVSTAVVATTAEPRGLAPPPTFPGGAPVPRFDPTTAPTDNLRPFYGLPQTSATTTTTTTTTTTSTLAVGLGGVVPLQSYGAPGAPWVPTPPPPPPFADLSMLPMLMASAPPASEMTASTVALPPPLPYFTAGPPCGVMMGPPQLQQQQQQLHAKQGPALYNVYPPPSRERASVEALTPAAAAAASLARGERRRSSGGATTTTTTTSVPATTSSAAATGTPQTIPRFVARLSNTPSERRLGHHHHNRQQGPFVEGEEDDGQALAHVRHSLNSPPPPPLQRGSSVERASTKSPSAVPPQRVEQSQSNSQWTPERALFGSGVTARASTEALAVELREEEDSAEGSGREVSGKQHAASPLGDVAPAHLDFLVEST